MPNKKAHWERVYSTRQPEEVSWTQKTPSTSVDFIHGFGLRKDARIIDIGDGDSKLADFLPEEGYEKITVPDISAAALEKAKRRPGDRAACVKWIVSDILDFQPDEQYNIWHDCATFHFLTTAKQIRK